MHFLTTDLPIEKSTKSNGKNFTNGITDRPSSSVRNTSITEKMNIIDGKAYLLVIYVIIPIEKICQYKKRASVIIALETIIDRIKPTNYL